MNQDLITAFKSIGIEIREDDIYTILRLGADRYLNGVRFTTSEESLAEIYIIMSEMRETKIKNL
jgi:hypothetical protein